MRPYFPFRNVYAVSFAMSVIVLLSFGLASNGTAAEVSGDLDDRPAVLFLLQVKPAGLYDYAFFRWLNERGIDSDFVLMHKQPDDPITWDRLKQYNALVIESPPGEAEIAAKHGHMVAGPPHRAEMKTLIDRFVSEGGGVMFAPSIQAYGDTIPFLRNVNDYLEPYGAAIPLDRLFAPSSEKIHPHSGVPFLYTQNIADAPVTDGVEGIWFPIGPINPTWYYLGGWAVKISPDWHAVVRGGPGSYTEPHTSTQGEREGYDLSDIPRRDEPRTPPPLFATRHFDDRPGRMALTAFWNIFLTRGGSSWSHDGVMIDKGLDGKPTDFGTLYANTLRWLAAPSMQSGELGGYAQDAAVLTHPHFRTPPTEQFPLQPDPQNADPNKTVFRGLIGARTELSGGSGDVAAYAAAAKEAGLDFVVFLERFTELTEAEARELEAMCKQYSDDELILTPGFTIRSNLGDHMMFFGDSLKLPAQDQVDGHGRLLLQDFDEDGRLTYEGKGKELLWDYFHKVPEHGTRNSGYFRFSDKGGQPVADLGLYGMLGLRTYADGELVDDVTEQYLDYTRDGNPPRLCAVNLVDSPDAMRRAVEGDQALTHVAAPSLGDVQKWMIYGHQYGREDVYPSAGPRIRQWAGTTRYQSFAGEVFIPSRARVRPLLWIESDVGLKEVTLYAGKERIRRFLLDGEKTFKHRFEWSFDRQKVVTVVATDVDGRNAVSAGREMWYEGNSNVWMADRQNSGELLWHGPLTMPGPKPPIFTAGPMWDGAGGRSFRSLMLRPSPGAVTVDGLTEGANRPMAGDMWNSCYDPSVANYIAVADRVYAPGRVSNAYHTFGPTHPSKLIDHRLHRTQYLHRIVGPRLDNWAFYPERRGGNMALIEGTFTFKQDAELRRLTLADLMLRRIDTGTDDKAIYLYRQSPDHAPFAGTLDTFHEHTGRNIPAGLTERPDDLYRIEPGGYLGVVGTAPANNAVIFNTGEQPMRFIPAPKLMLELAMDDPGVKQGQRIDYAYLVLYDALGEAPQNLGRIELLRRYFGLTPDGRIDIEVTRGTIRSTRGVIELSPQDHVIEFHLPDPGFKLNTAVGLRFRGFNPNWTVGLHQLQGYSPGYYTDGNDVYRSLGLDDQGVGHLAAYPDHAGGTRSAVGHPVVCDEPDVNIQVTRLRESPNYYVAVNNPTNRTITTTVRTAMPDIGLDLPATELTLEPGAFEVVLDER